MEKERKTINKETFFQQIADNVTDVKHSHPFVPSITNSVTVNMVANTQIAVGGSPAMFYMPDEGENMASACDALYINMGTLLPVYGDTVKQTVLKLNELNKPWVLDPVGMNKGRLHNELIAFMKENTPHIIKGNASEIMALGKAWGLSKESVQIKGVDSANAVDDAEVAAIWLADFIQGAVVVTGEIDLITDGKTVIRSHGGSEWMEKITGAGCMLGGVIAVYAAGGKTLVAATTGVNAFNHAGKLAGEIAKGPGSFQAEFLDQLYLTSSEAIATNPIQVKDVK